MSVTPYQPALIHSTKTYWCPWCSRYWVIKIYKAWSLNSKTSKKRQTQKPKNYKELLTFPPYSSPTKLFHSYSNASCSILPHVLATYPLLNSTPLPRHLPILIMDLFQLMLESSVSGDFLSTTSSVIWTPVLLTLNPPVPISHWTALQLLIHFWSPQPTCVLPASNSLQGPLQCLTQSRCSINFGWINKSTE